MNIRDLLEKDKERLMTRLANADNPEQAARECEDEIGRLLLEYNEQAPSDRVGEAAYYSMQTARAAISLVDSTGEIRAYERTGVTEVSGKNYVIPLAGGIGAMAAGGLVLALAPAVLAPVGLIGLIVALTYSIPHAMTANYQYWVLVLGATGYVPSSICYYGWALSLTCLGCLIVNYFSTKKAWLYIPAYAVAAALLGTAAAVTSDINHFYREIPGATGEQISYRAQ